jgi:hypothetical protein
MSSMNRLGWLLACALMLEGASDPIRDATPPPSPKMARPPGRVLFSDDFHATTLASGWRADKPEVWSLRRGVLKADMPDGRQQRSFLYTGSDEWTDYAVDLDVCAMRGADKGIAVRVVEGEGGMAVDLRGSSYQDVLLQRREWPLAKADVTNANGQWQHLRVECRGRRYRVWVNDTVLIDKEDSRKARTTGGIALAAYTGGVGECTLYYDNIVVTSLASSAQTSTDVDDGP